MEELDMEEQKTKHHRGRGKKNKKRDIVGNIVLVVALAVFAVSAFQLYTIFSEYREGDKQYSNIQDVAIVETKKPDTKEPEQNQEQGTEAPEAVPEYKIDFGKLKSINPDVVGWIQFEEPSKINYPIVHGTDNSKYLTTTFEGKKNKFGTIFVDVDNAGDFSDRNTFIYGHHMNNGSMFAKLLKYKDVNYYKAHPYFYIYTPNGMINKYQIFATSVVKDTSDSYIKWYEDDEAYQNYLSYIEQEADYVTGVEVTAESKIVSLSTCTNVRDDERYLVHAVKISEEPVE